MTRVFKNWNAVSDANVMVQFEDVNVSNEMNGPSGCDVAKVKVDDDTPVVSPKP